MVIFLTDTREQMPLQFGPTLRKEFSDGGSRIATLQEGDYSIAFEDGEPLSIRLERKSLGDLYGVIGFGRDRFERELERLRSYQYAAIIIEATLDEVLRGFSRSSISPRAAIGSLCAWSTRYGVAVWFAENHRRAAGIAQRLLEAFAVDELRKSG